MSRLLVAANSDCEKHLHDFAFDLYGILYIHGRRLKSPLVNSIIPPVAKTPPDYIANQRERQEKLEQAAQCLTGLRDDLYQLDLYHLRDFAFFYNTPTGRTRYDGPQELFAEIDLAARVITACQKAYSSIFKTPAKKRGPRPLPYVDATRELINLWEKYAGNKVPVSKTHQHEVANNPAEFIRLGISLIDPNASDANVVTAINNALSQSERKP